MNSVELGKIADRIPEISFSSLLKTAAESILIVDQMGRIIWTNRKTCDLFGYSQDELIEKRVEMLVPERYRQVHVEHREKYFSAPRNRPMGSGLDLTARRKNGTEFPVEISLSHSGSNDELQVMVIIRDITRLKQAEAAKEEFQKRQIEQKEEEIRALERMGQGPSTIVTAGLLDVAPLKQAAPAIFNNLVEQYVEAMDLALERRIYKTEHPLSETLRNMAETIGFYKGTARDVVDIHRAALKLKSEKAQTLKVQGYIEEGHLLLVELMGYLASRYRHYAIGTRQPQSQSGMK